MLEECYVTSEARKLREEIERWENHFGTSFFLNFAPFFDIHQIGGDLGNMVRANIAESLHKRFIEVLTGAQLPSNLPSIEELTSRLYVTVCAQEQLWANNGEVYFWLQKINLNEDLIFKIMRTLRSSLKENPIVVPMRDKDYEVPFYGWGFRCYH